MIEIQSGNESQSTANEKFFCSHLKMEIINVITEQDDSDSDIEENDKKPFRKEAPRIPKQSSTCKNKKFSI